MCVKCGFKVYPQAIAQTGGVQGKGLQFYDAESATPPARMIEIVSVVIMKSRFIPVTTPYLFQCKPGWTYNYIKKAFYNLKCMV